MTNIKAVLFNGPPRSGKDTAAEWLEASIKMRLSTQSYLPFNYKMAESLKLATHALFGEDGTHADAFEECKDEPHPVFLGMTPRKAYIDMAENFAKPRYGHDFFGKIFMHRITQKIKKETENTGLDALIITSDLGFKEEAQVMADQIGAANMLIIHVHRRDCDFTNDSRSYIKIPGAHMLALTNDNIEAYRLEVYKKVRFWLDNGITHSISA